MERSENCGLQLAGLLRHLFLLDCASLSLLPFSLFASLSTETPPYSLSDDFITPQELFYVRGHFPVPDIAPEDYTLSISGLSIRPLNLTLDQIKSLFPHHSVCASLQCAGNRRRDMSAERETQGLQWGSGAIGTAVWTGVKLRDVLRYAGLLEYSRGDAGKGKPKHVQVSLSGAKRRECDAVLGTMLTVLLFSW